MAYRPSEKCPADGSVRELSACCRSSFSVYLKELMCCRPSKSKVITIPLSCLSILWAVYVFDWSISNKLFKMNELCEID